jgi:hypothetical protein
MAERQLPKLCVGAARSPAFLHVNLARFAIMGRRISTSFIAVVVSHRLVAGRFVEREFVLARLSRLGQRACKRAFADTHINWINDALAVAKRVRLSQNFCCQLVQSAIILDEIQYAGLEFFSADL